MSEELLDFTVSKSKTPRNARQLPTLHYIVADDWIDKLGEKSFCLYLKLWTMVDRTGEQHEIKTRQSKLIQRLGMSKSTFLRTLKPLYEYGLVDLQEYEGSKNEGNKPVNIIVHRNPQNEPTLAFEPIEKVRDWSTRTDVKYSFTKKGGRPKKVETPEPEHVLDELPEDVINVLDDNLDRLKDNKVDIEVLIQWIKDSKDKVAISDMILVIEQLASYVEPVKKTIGAITFTINNADKIRKALIKTEINKSAEESSSTHENRDTSFYYNWLDDEEDQA